MYPLTIDKLTGEIQPFCPAIHAANVEVVLFVLIVRWPVVWFARGVERLKGKVAGALRFVVVRSSARGVGLFGPGFCWQCSLWWWFCLCWLVELPQATARPCRFVKRPCLMAISRRQSALAHVYDDATSSPLFWYIQCLLLRSVDGEIGILRGGIVMTIDNRCREQRSVADKMFMDFKYTAPGSPEQISSLKTLSFLIGMWSDFLQQEEKRMDAALSIG